MIADKGSQEEEMAQHQQNGDPWAFSHEFHDAFGIRRVQRQEEQEEYEQEEVDVPPVE